MSKKSFIALAALAAMAGSALAADVTLYGRIDNGLYLTKSKAKDTTSVSMESGIAGASRWGIKGSEDLGNGYKVGFVLESGIKTDTGMGDSKRLFDRDSYLSLATPYGDFRFGRSGALGGGVSGGIFAGNASPFGVVFKEAASTKIFAVETRVDNMVRYDTPKFAGLKFMAQYSNGTDGDDTVPSSQRDRYGAIGASYEIGGLKLFAVADKLLHNDAAKKGTKDTNAYKLAAQYKVVDTVTLYGGYQFVDNAQKVGIVTASGIKGADSHAATLGSRIKLGGGDLNLVVGYVTGDQKVKEVKHEVKAWQAAVGYTYHLSKRTHVYGVAAYFDSKYKQDGKTIWSGKDTTGSEKAKSLMCGMYHTF